MVDKSVMFSSKNTTPVRISSQALVSRPLAKNLKVCERKGAFPSRQSDRYLAEDLPDISDAEVGGYLNNKKEYILNRIAWEMMNPDYQKRKSTARKKKDPINKTAPSKQTSTTRTESNAENENEKRLSSDINYDVLDKLFDAENSPKRSKLEKPVAVGDQMKYSQQSTEECLLKPQSSEEEEPDCNEDCINEDAYGGVEEFYGDADLEIEDQDEREDEE